ncbi:uncharacterized protein LOC132300287 [Cornus florida]|uniref:uncharacterized protein LOC132300287 n=1 Tax=Cornus florida TaxID=4283 RepID=UPI00289DE785|nr:uncharacterized protein LOC132300287 [Cornus florida]
MLETLSEHFPRFKLASGELGDGIAIAISKPLEPVALEIVNSGRNLVSPGQISIAASPNLVMREELMKLSGKGMKEAAAIMKVSIYTLRRRCRKCGIQRWGSDSSSDLTLVNPVIAPQPRAGNPVATPSRIISATCGGDTIKFTLPLSSGMVELKEKVSMRLEKLIGGSYKIKYKDDLGSWILMACDHDVQDCLNDVMNVSNPFDLKAVISMVIEPVI